MSSLLNLTLFLSITQGGYSLLNRFLNYPYLLQETKLSTSKKSITAYFLWHQEAMEAMPHKQMVYGLYPKLPMVLLSLSNIFITMRPQSLRQERKDFSNLEIMFSLPLQTAELINVI